MTANPEFESKHARVKAWLAENGVDAVLFCTPANVSWLGCGGELPRAAGAPGFVLTADRCILLCATEDADRVRQEEVRGLPVELVAVLSLAPESLADRAKALVPEATRWKTDNVLTGMDRVVGLDVLRRSLHPDEAERLVRLAHDATAAVEEVAAECYRGISERDAAARLAAECVRRNVGVREILAGADERFESYARPIPKGAVAERTLVLGLVGSRGGLHVALSRTVCVASPEEPFLQRFANGVEIAARLRHCARLGETLGSVVQQALPQPMLHLGLLGGAIGHTFIEEEARPSSAWKLGPHQAVVWSVVSAGLRLQDTDLAGTDGFRLVTTSENWPRRSVHIDTATYELPDLLLV